MIHRLGCTLRPSLLVGAPAAVAALLWSYATTLADVAERWSTDPQYSHGYLVPLFAAVLLWLRRDQLAGAGLHQPVAIINRPRPIPVEGLSAVTTACLSASWWGLVVLLGAVTMRLWGAYFHFVWLDPLSLLPCLAGACLLLAGRTGLRWAGPAIAFLFFMIPLPYSLANALSGPLQLVATQASTFALQVLGRPAIAEGHVIRLNEVDLGVVEACSGLRMLVVFFALSTAMALVIHRPLWQKVVVCASALPIALFCNILRITLTGVLKENDFGQAADVLFHDVAGWLMMPLAIALLGLELKLFKHLWIEPRAYRGPETRQWRLDAPVPRRRCRHQRPIVQPFAESQAAAIPTGREGSGSQDRGSVLSTAGGLLTSEYQIRGVP